MNFTFNGQTFDTDKPIYVAGFQYGPKKYWDKIEVNDLFVFRQLQKENDCSLRCKRAYVNEIIFDPEFVAGQFINSVYGMKLWIPNEEFFTVLQNDSNVIIGTTPNQVFKILREKHIIE